MERESRIEIRQPVKVELGVGLSAQEGMGLCLGEILDGFHETTFGNLRGPLEAWAEQDPIIRKCVEVYGF